ncbi:MAG: hypothetical protein KME45_28890 [Stenomitos rutilans HA7619-LM2]|nr:hypothetical protein [Stenomitos rutilans HA7619-LM2]MBW4474359.1 hypothetical protein [Stenomitos rutilans HA7619-LM2]
MTTADGLVRLLGLLAIGAVRLPPLRTFARTHPETPTPDAMPDAMIPVLTARQALPHPPQTLGEFWRSLAQ